MNESIFIVNKSESRKLLAEILAKSPMFDVIATKVKNRYLEVEGGHYLYDFGSQDYLGLTFDERVINAANEATCKYGTVVAWCRLVGAVDLFEIAEQKIAKLVGSEACSIFASTTLVNHGVIPALAGKDGVIILDKSAHATMYEGAKIARDSGAILVSFTHDDYEELEVLLKEYMSNEKKIILLDGTYSMTGDYPDLPKIDQLAKKYNALVYVDDAHGFGVVGENPSDEFPYGHKGNGIVKYFGLNYENIVYIGCFSKAYGTFGAFIACSVMMRNYLMSQATPHDLGGMGPASAMAALIAGLDINEAEGEEKRITIDRLTQKALKGLREMGYLVKNKTGFPILSVWVGPDVDMIGASKIIYENHILLTLSPYPMVRKGEEAFRVTITCTNTDEEIEQLIEAFRILKEYLVHNGIKFPISEGIL